MDQSAPPFWKVKSLEAMTEAEWESLCDGCGRCCLVKLEDEDTGEYYATDVACRLLDTDSCRCQNYGERQSLVPDCVRLTPTEARTLGWLPKTCAYRMLAEGRDLKEWHPLISGRPESVIEAGISVRGRVHCHEDAIAFEDLVDRIKAWPLKDTAVQVFPRKKK
jgi:uncharacterized cysteine cluster protein YcgN (CxxCxxCC family)